MMSTLIPTYKGYNRKNFTHDYEEIEMIKQYIPRHIQALTKTNLTAESSARVKIAHRKIYFRVNYKVTVKHSILRV